MAESGDVKPGQQPITLKIREQDGNEILFKVKRSTPMSKVFAAFYGKKSAQVGSYKFLLDGDRLADTDTAESRDLEEGAIIEASIEQVGGCL